MGKPVKQSPTLWERKGLVSPGRKHAAWLRLEALKDRYRRGDVCFCADIDSANNASNVGRKFGPRRK